jgi:tRNA(Ile)-lysidine synthase
MALLDVLARLREPMGFALAAHGVDHGLRPDAARELDVAEALAESHGVDFTRSRLALEPGGNLQARARDARYAALARAATRAGARLVATAHHADDRAETVLLRLLRGAGPGGLAVLPPRAPFPVGAERELELVRPLLRARRADVDAHLARHGIPFALDPSNEDPRFLRARVRHELLPLLAALSPGIVGHLCALADALAGGRPADPELERLPRAARLALAELARAGNTRARVRLPAGALLGASDRSAADRPDEDENGRARRAAPFAEMAFEVGLVERRPKAHLTRKVKVGI